MRALPALVFSAVALAIPSVRAQAAPGNDTSAAAPAPATAPATQTPATTASTPSSTTTETPAAAPATHRSTVPGLGNFTFEPSASEKKHAEELAKAEQEAEEEKPRNGIVRLPTYQVNEDRPPVFTKNQLDTKKGLGADAVKKYLSSTQQALNFVHLPAWLGGMSNEDLALEMYHDQVRLDTRRDLLHEASQLQSAGDLDSASDLRQQSQDLYMRPHEDFSAPNANLNH